MHPHITSSASPHLAGLLLVLLQLLHPLTASAATPSPKVTRPPESFFQWVPEKHQTKARSFYSKYLNIQGLPVAASKEVSNQALLRTHHIVTHMLAGRPDIIQAMIHSKTYLIIIGKDQVYTDMPEYSDHPNPRFMNERVRGTGGNPTSFGEENLLSLPLDRYDDESIAVHEFCHTIDTALAQIDPSWKGRLFKAHQRALNQGLWKNTYAASNPGEFWAEIAQSYFDCNRANNWNHGHVRTREQLQAYDPESYELVRSIFNLSPAQDWRYSWLQPLPNITTPPARFQIDPFYTQFTWARETIVLGRGCSPQALLKANDIIRKMFAYRHDILKIFINQGAHIVVLGPHESLAQLPELKNKTTSAQLDLNARFLDYQPQLKLMVVAQENILGDPSHAGVGPNQIIRGFAKAFHQLTATRPVDPNWENRGQDVQQYELRVQRLDTRFGQELDSLYQQAQAAGRWKGTAAGLDVSQYWTAGVLAYFDAAGQEAAPHDTSHPIRTREQLAHYDAPLHALVEKTMAYKGHVDWRFSPAHQQGP